MIFIERLLETSPENGTDFLSKCGSLGYPLGNTFLILITKFTMFYV